jgi:hypothetical protein
MCGKLLEERTHDTAVGVSGVNVTLMVWEQHKDNATSTLPARQLEKRSMLATTTSVIIKQEDEENVRDGLGRSKDETMSSSSRQPPVYCKLATSSKSTASQLVQIVRCYASTELIPRIDVDDLLVVEHLATHSSSDIESVRAMYCNRTRVSNCDVVYDQNRIKSAVEHIRSCRGIYQG